MNKKTYALEHRVISPINKVKLRENERFNTNFNSDRNNWLNSLNILGLKNLGQVHWNLSVPQLVEHTLAKGEGSLAANGAGCV